MKFLRKLLVEIAQNGKLLIGYIIQSIPELTNYPGLKTALEEFVANPNSVNGFKLLFQLFLLGAAGHRFVKILFKAIDAR
jgi:hypothetical protein